MNSLSFLLTGIMGIIAYILIILAWPFIKMGGIVLRFAKKTAFITVPVIFSIVYVYLTL